MTAPHFIINDSTLFYIIFADNHNAINFGSVITNSNPDPTHWATIVLTTTLHKQLQLWPIISTTYSHSFSLLIQIIPRTKPILSLRMSYTSQYQIHHISWWPHAISCVSNDINFPVWCNKQSVIKNPGIPSLLLPYRPYDTVYTILYDMCIVCVETEWSIFSTMYM